MVQITEPRHAEGADEHAKVIDNAVTKVNTAKEELAGVFKTVTSVLEETKTALKTLATQRDELSREMGQIQKQRDDLAHEKTQLLQEKIKLESTTKTLEHDKDTLTTAKGRLEKDKAAADHTIEAMTGEQKRLLQEYATLQSDLKRMSSVAKDLGQKEFNFQQVQAVLSIYMVLLEQVWQSQPHFKVLYLLHGQRSEMSRQDLTKASGISAAMVLRALFELRNANLVYYDENTGMAKLVRRFLNFNTDELDKDKVKKATK
jgi:DNA repair exonuclease SbcCD ATPase subunit